MDPGRFQVLNVIVIIVWLCLLVTGCPTCGSGTTLVLCSLEQIVQLVLFSDLETEWHCTLHLLCTMHKAIRSWTTCAATCGWQR